MQKIEQPYKSKTQFMILSFFISIGSLGASYSTTCLNDGLTKIKTVLEIDSSFLEGLIVSASMFSACLSTIITYFFIDKLSRRQLLFLADILMIVGSASVMIQNIYLFIIGRILQGFGMGFGLILSTLMVYQMTPKQLISITGGSNSVMFSLGIFVSSLLGLNFKGSEKTDDDQYFWRIYFGFPLIFSVIRMTAFLFIYRLDSPAYYLQNNQPEKAEEFVNKYYKKEYQVDVFNFYQKEAYLKAAKSISFKQVFKSPYLKPLLLGTTMQLLQQLVGITAVTFYSTKIFQQSFSDDVSLDLTLAYSIIRIVSYSFASIFMMSFGRRKVIFIGSIFMTLNCIIFTTLSQFAYQSYSDQTSDLLNKISIIFLFLYLIGLFLSYGSMVQVYLSEVLPPKIYTVCSIIIAFCGFILITPLPFLFDKFGGPNLFVFFSFMCLLSIFITYKYVPESKGCTRDEMIIKINGKQSSTLIEKDESTKINGSDLLSDKQ